MTDRFSPWGLAQSGSESGEQRAFMTCCNRIMWCGFEGVANELQWNAMTPIMAGRVQNNAPAIPALRWIHSIPNGGDRAPAVAGNMKAEGVKSGVADIFWPSAQEKLFYTMPSQPTFWHGWYCEMKRKNGKLSDLSANQLLFREHVLAEGYAWCWARGWEDARDKLIAYAAGQWTEQMEQV